MFNEMVGMGQIKSIVVVSGENIKEVVNILN